MKNLLMPVLLLCLLPQSLLASPAPDHKSLKDIQNKITTSSERARKYEQQTRTVDREITGLQQNLVTAARNIQLAEQDVYSKEDRLDMLNRQEKTLKNKLASRYGQMAKTLAAMERLSRQPAELVTFRPDTTINSLRSASLLKILQPELKKRAETIQQNMTDLTIVREKITLEREQLKTLLASLTSEQIDMNKLLAARQQKKAELRKATRRERQKLKQFAAKAKNLQDLIARIDRENKARAKARVKEREAAARAAARRLTDKPGHVQEALKQRNSDRQRLDSLRTRGSSFSKAKGTMPLPVRGAIRRAFGTRTPEGRISEGITIHTLPRATVVSPHEGRIVFAGKFRSYGLLLIISHGPEYHTLLAGMTRLDAEVGQWVLKGEPVGQMAASSKGQTSAGGDSGQNLYVELRRMGRPINPLPWIVARDRKVL